MRRIRADGRTDFANPRYYNIRWLQHLEEAHRAFGRPGSVLEAPAIPLPQ